MAKRFALTITDTAFDFSHKAEAIASEARFDGFYVLRTSLTIEQVDTAGTVRAYNRWPRWSKRFAAPRPLIWICGRCSIGRRHGCAHVLLCMLAHYLEWHMRQPWRRCCSMTMAANGRGRAGIARTCAKRR